MESALDDFGIPPQVVEVANDNQEWKIYGIIDKEDVEDMLHYWEQNNGVLHYNPNMKWERRALW
jgi:hypothetical protein